MKDIYAFEYVIAYEIKTGGYTIRANTDVSTIRFIPIAGFPTFEQAEYFKNLIKEKGGIEFLEKVDRRFKESEESGK